MMYTESRRVKRRERSMQIYVIDKITGRLFKPDTPEISPRFFIYNDRKSMIGRYAL